MPLSTRFQLYRDGSVLLVEETRVPRENNLPAASYWQTLYLPMQSLPWVLVKDTRAQIHRAAQRVPGWQIWGFLLMDC